MIRQKHSLRHNLRQSQKQLQRVSIAPQMIGVLRALPCSLPQLIERMQHELASNPFLKEEEKYEVPVGVVGAVDQPSIVDRAYDNDWERGVGFARSRHADPKAKPVASIIEQTVRQKRTLSQDLLTQLRLVYKEASLEFAVGEMVVGSLDERGYFHESKVGEIAQNFGTEDGVVRGVLGVVQTFSPYGIAATSVEQCLLAQLKQLRRKTVPIEEQIVREHFGLLRRRQHKTIAEKMGYSVEAVRQAANNIALLEPYPARAYGSNETHYIVPDVYVFEREGQLRAQYNNDALPKIRYNDEYKVYGGAPLNDELKTYLRNKSDKATILLNSLDYRETNLMKVIKHLLRVQEGFFRKGYSYLEPYTLSQLSEDLDINPGTLSRIVNNKFVQTKWGIFGLRIFFSTALKTRRQNVSSNKVKNLIRMILRSHSGGKRLSDLELTRLLRQKGYLIARRTVAKYRNKLQIPSSFYR